MTQALLQALWTEIGLGLDFLVIATKSLCQTSIIIDFIFCHKIKQFSFVFDIQTKSGSELVYIGCLFHFLRTYGHWFCNPIQLPEQCSCILSIIFASMQVMHLSFVDNKFWHTEKQLILSGKFFVSLLFRSAVFKTSQSQQRKIHFVIYFILNVDLIKHM